MIYKSLKIIQIGFYQLNYQFNRFLLKQFGVKTGKNLRTFSITTIENPKGITIGDNVWISKNVAFYALNGIRIGNNVIIAKDVSFISSDHEYSDIKTDINKQGMQIIKKPIVIDNNVWIGEKTIILKSVNIGKGCVIGAGSVVTKSFPPFSVIAGNPAKIIKKRNE